MLAPDQRSERSRQVRSYRLGSLAAHLLCLFPVSLPRLFQWFGSDKQMAGEHSYGPAYQMLLRQWKYRRIRMLEIGIGGHDRSLGGHSLLAWLAFFPFGHIFGADIEDKSALAGWRRTILPLDQSSPSQLATLAATLTPLDLIIDDGSHLSAHQILTFETLFDALKDDGIYIVEDVQTSFWPGVVAGYTWDGAAIDDPDFGRTCAGYFLELTKYLNQAEFVDRSGLNETMARFAGSIRQITFEHNLIIVRKGDNREASNYLGR